MDVAIDYKSDNKEIAVAIMEVLKIHMQNYESDLGVQRLKASFAQMREEMINQAKVRAECEDEGDPFSSFLYTVGKIAAIAAVAYFAPTFLAQVAPSLLPAGSVTSAAATGVAMGTADAAAQGVGVAMGVQDHISGNEIAETMISGAAGMAAANAQLTVAQQAAVVGGTAAATQEGEIKLGTRDDFDFKSIGEQMAASVIANSLKQVEPQVKDMLGSETYGDVATTAAKVSINAIIDAYVHGTSIDVSNLAADIMGTLAGDKLGKTINDKIADQPAIHFDPNKICLMNGSETSPLPKFTPLNVPSPDEFFQKIKEGKFEEAKQQVLDAVCKKTVDEQLADIAGDDPQLKAIFEEAKQRVASLPTPDNSTAKILAALGYSGPSNDASLPSSNVEAQVNTPNTDLVTEMADALKNIKYRFNATSAPQKVLIAVAGVGVVALIVPAAVLTVAALVDGAAAGLTVEGMAMLDALGMSALKNVTARIVAAMGAGKLIAKFGLVESEETIAELNGARAKLLGTAHAYKPGEIANRKAVTFFAQKYTSYVLEEDIIVYRVGNHERELGEYFTFERPASEIQSRIDSAIVPKWPTGDTSVIDTAYKVKIPKGTIVHIGDSAPQGQVFVGGTQQIFIEKPWQIPGVEVLDEFEIEREISWNHQAKLST